MIFNVYALKDEKVGFKQPFFSFNEKEVIVSFARLVNDSKCPFPVEDTSLYLIGTFDDESGDLNCVCNKASGCPIDNVLIVKGIDLLEKKEEVHGEQN